MDAVLHPLAVLDPCAFYQEGWHYEIDDNGSLSYKGVVLNEMLGDYSSPESVCDRYMNEMLYRDTLYAEDSGGDPDKIIDLTYEQFVGFNVQYFKIAVGKGLYTYEGILNLINEYLNA